MIGGRTTVPVANSTGPGTPMLIARRWSAGCPAAASSSADLLRTPARTASGPSLMSMVARRLGQHPAAEVGDGQPAVGGAEVDRADHGGGVGQVQGQRRAAAVGGRRPVSTSRPRSMSRSTRWAMAARDSPVAPTIAERVVAAPSATSPASSLSDAMRRLAALFIRPLPSASGDQAPDASL